MVDGQDEWSLFRLQWQERPAQEGSSLDERLTVSSAAGVRLRAWPPEVDDEQAVRERLWLRGGVPDSYLAAPMNTA